MIQKKKEINDPESMDFMEEALNEAMIALEEGEIPVGAVVVLNGTIIGRGHNRKETLNDPSSHAEVNAIRDAAKNTGNWRLSGAEIYVTLEPCPMCTSLITQCRIERAIIGCPEYRSGAMGSKIDMTEDIASHHNVQVVFDIRKEAEDLLDTFFENARRSLKKEY